MSANQWQINLARDLGGEDGCAAVEGYLREMGVEETLAVHGSDPSFGWDEAARARVAHKQHVDLHDPSDPEDAADPFRWDEQTVAAYYAAYGASARKRSEEIAQEQRRAVERATKKLTGEAQDLAPGFGVEILPTSNGLGLALWCGNDAWGLPAEEGEARTAMTTILTKHAYFTAPK